MAQRSSITVFGYHVDYRAVDDQQRVVILAFWHFRRGRFPHLESDDEPE